MLPFAKLVTFVKAVECGSFTRAALVLGSVHSGLSRQVGELEAELGYRLLERTGRGVRLTEQGAELYERARLLIAEAEALHDEARALRGVPFGTVTIGLPGSVATLLASRLLVEAARKYPQIRLRVIEGLSGAVEEMLGMGRVDLGLYFALPTRKLPNATALYSSDLYLVGPFGNALVSAPAIETAALADLRLILPSSQNAIRVAVEDACAQAGVSCYIACETDSLSIMKHAVEIGAGYTVSGWESVAREVKAGRLAASRLVSPGITRVLHLETGRQRALTIAARTMHQEVRGLVLALREEPEWRLQAPPFDVNGAA